VGVDEEMIRRYVRYQEERERETERQQKSYEPGSCSRGR